MTNWVTPSNRENGVLITVPILQQIINNTANINERIQIIESTKGGVTPIGAIMLWKGNKAAIPSGYQLADGTNGTPDLRGRFLMGIPAGEDDDNITETGGAIQHIHAMGTVSAATKHKHVVYINDCYNAVSCQTGATDSAWGNHNHDWSAETSSNDEHTHSWVYAETNNLPPYTKYYWIARIPA